MYSYLFTLGFSFGLGCSQIVLAFDRQRTTRRGYLHEIHFLQVHLKVSLEAIQSLGGNGYINDYPTGRLLRDAKLYEIGAGTSEIRRILIGRELFKDSA